MKRSHGIFYTFEGDAEAKPVAHRLVRALDGRWTSIASPFKPLYHCAGAFASGGLLAPLSIAYDLYEAIGIKRSTARAMLKPLVDATLDAGQSSRLRESITGPVSRGDQLTIAEHLRALRRMTPQFLEFYVTMSRRLFDLASEKLSPGQKQSIRKLLTDSRLKRRRR